MTPSPEKNPAAIETAGLEIAIQRQREGSADPGEKKSTTAAGAVEKAVPIPAEDAVDTVASILASHDGRKYVTGRDLEVAEEIVAALAGGQEERIREDEPGFVQLPDGWLAVEMKAVEREFATWPKGLRSSFEALLRDADRARLRGVAS